MILMLNVHHSVYVEWLEGYQVRLEIVQQRQQYRHHSIALV